MTIVDQLRQRKSYINSTEAISILGVTRATFCGWVRSGKMPAIRLGGGYVVDPQVLSAWLEARRV